MFFQAPRCDHCKVALNETHYSIEGRAGRGKEQQALIGGWGIGGEQSMTHVAQHSQPTLVQDIAGRVAEGHWEVLLNGTLFRSIRGVQSKLQLIETPNALESLSKCVRRGCCVRAPACDLPPPASAWPRAFGPVLSAPLRAHALVPHC
jgi:hypothetical protein